MGLSGHRLRVTDAGTPVIITEATGNIGNIVESGHAVALDVDALSFTQISLANQIGSTKVISVSVDGVTAFTCPSASDPYKRQVFCSGP